MKLKYNMEILDLDGSPMAVPLDSGEEFRGVLHMNSTAASILEILKNDTTEEEIISSLKKEYAATEEQIMNICSFQNHYYSDSIPEKILFRYWCYPV